MKTENKINASFETLCAVWPPQNTTDVLAGVLSSHKGKVNFLTAPKYEVLGGEQAGQRFMQAGTLRIVETIPCFQGRTQSDKCTLFGLFEEEHPGVLDLRSGENLYSTKYRAWATVLGLHLSGPAAPEIDSAVFRFSDVHQWMPTAWATEFTDGEIAYRIPREAVEVFSFSSLHLNAEIRCEVQAFGHSKTRGKTSLVPVPLIRVTPREPQSLEWFLDLLPRFENFFSLLLGTSVAPKHVGFFKDGDAGWLIKRQRRRRQKPNVQMWVRCEPHAVARALAQWIAVSEDEQAIERTLLGTLRKSSLFIETEFLSLAQALEAFGRIHHNPPLIEDTAFKDGLKKIKATVQTVFGDTPVAQRCSQMLCHGNETSFGDKLRYICDLLPDEFFEKHLDKKDELVRRTVQTRNFFTHLGIRPGGLAVRGGKPLFLLNQKLTALLRCVMLLELGIAFTHIQEPVAYQAKRWS